MTKTLLNEALRRAEQSLDKHPQFDHYLHWSFIVQHNTIIEWGMNREAEPPPQWGYRKNSKLHSEYVAYKKARGVLASGPFELINVRLNRQGQPKLSQPCRTCRQWLDALGCQRIVFTTNDGWASAIV